MKIAIIALLLLLGSAFICLQTDAARSLLDEVKKERTTQDQAEGKIQIGQTHEASKTGAYDIEPKDSQEKSDPPADSNGQASTSNTADGNDKNEDEKNDNFGTYGNPSGSTTETHRHFADVNRPH